MTLIVLAIHDCIHLPMPGYLVIPLPPKNYVCYLACLTGEQGRQERQSQNC
jgi:hypothetical protein